uniref:Uncharacterized protein n=1 Tax=Fagus sylvatica TaxID=28930 RepID=A0A2N9IK62_FAGSY
MRGASDQRSSGSTKLCGAIWSCSTQHGSHNTKLRGTIWSCSMQHHAASQTGEGASPGFHKHTESETLGSSYPFQSRSATQVSGNPSLILATMQKHRRILDSPRPVLPPLRGSAAQFSTLH